MSVADEIRKLADLKNEGLLTEEEFESQKRLLLSDLSANKPADQSQDAVPLGKVAEAAPSNRSFFTPTKALVIAVGVIGIIVILLWGGGPESKDRQKERDVIKLCWSDYKKKSNSHESMRFIASVCEKLENDFERKHGLKP